MQRVKTAVRHLLRWGAGDYREKLFEDLCAYLNGMKPSRILEIGPKDGRDTRRLLGLEPETLVLIDVPRMREVNEAWLCEMNSSRIEYISANLMYSEVVNALERFDCIWCTGVLYHNPEQLRMVKRLYDLLNPGGVLVLESATTRQRRLRNANCVEILYPPSAAVKRKHNISLNVTHLPSVRAIASWMQMVGFERVVQSGCHHRPVSAALARSRAAFLGTKPLHRRVGTYYSIAGEEGYEIGKAL